MNIKNPNKMFKETIHFKIEDMSCISEKNNPKSLKHGLLKPNMQIESFTTGLLLLSPLTHFNPVCSVYLVAAAKHCKFECKKVISESKIYFSYFSAYYLLLQKLCATYKYLLNIF